MFKLNSKTKVEELKSILNANYSKVKKKDKNLYDQITYAGKNPEKATKKDLYDLAKQVINLLGDKLVVPAVAEEPTKTETTTEEKPKKKISKKVESEQAVKKPKKKTSEEKQKEEKPKESKKSAVEEEEASSKQAIQLAKIFPATLTVGEDTYEIARDITSMGDLYNALNDEQDIVVAHYWTKRHLKQFPYYNCLLGQPKSFDNDLDLSTLIYVSDEKKVAYAVSMYTEAPYALLPSDIKETDEGLRFADGIEFQIYRRN